MATEDQMGAYAPESPRSGLSNGTVVGAGDARFELVVDGQLYTWPDHTITASDIRTLADLAPSAAIIERDPATGEERRMADDAVHELAPQTPDQHHRKRVAFRHED